MRIMQPLLRKEFLFTRLIALIPNSLFYILQSYGPREATSPGLQQKQT